MSSITILDYIVLIVYFGAMAAMGPYFASRNKTAEGYFLGNRSFPGWLVGISMFATSISSVTFVAYPGDAYKTAWLRMMPNFMLPVGVLIAVLVFIPFFRRNRITSAFEYLEGRFGPKTRLYAACAFILGQVIRVSLILFLVSLLVHELTGMDKYLSILLGGVITSFYSVLGGIRAVLWTDFIQAIVLWLGGLLCLLVIIFSVPGGAGRIFSEAMEDGKFMIGDMEPAGTESLILSENVPNTGVFEWTIPADIPRGNDYMVRISRTGSRNPSDVSNVNFRIDTATQNPLTLIYPNWGDEWFAGQTHTIEWTPQNAAQNVDLLLLKRRETFMTIAEGIPDSGRFEWSIPAEIPDAKDYRILLRAGDRETVSRTYFSVARQPAANSLIVARPNGDDIWTPGSTQQITWTANPGDTNPVSIELVRGRGLHPASWKMTLTGKTIWVMLLLGLVNWLAEYSCNQNVVQRYVASKSAKEARRASWICCIFSVPTWGLFMILGTCLYVYFKLLPDPDAAAILYGIHGAKAEQILPYFIIRNLPTGISGLVIAGVLAAAMSSLSSSINSVSAVGLVDIYKRYVVTDLEEDHPHYVLVARIIGCVLAVIMVLGAAILMMAETKTLQDTATVLGAMTAGGLLGVYMLGFFTKVGDGRAIGVGIVCAVFFSGWMALSAMNWLPPAFISPIDSYWAGILGHLIAFVIGFGLGCVLPKRPRDLTNMTVWTQDGTPVE